MRGLARTKILVTAIVASSGAMAAEPPFVGCFERIYDSAHLAAHKDQFPTRVILHVKPTTTPMKAPGGDIAAEADLRMWVAGYKERFDSNGACSVSGQGLSCGGSISAAEADFCKTGKTGVRECRVNLGDSGGFDIMARPDGLIVTIKGRLELVPAPYDSGPFLNLSDKDSENRTFFLKPAAGDVCK